MGSIETTTQQELLRCVNSCFSRPHRSMLEFAEQEIRIPDGPVKGFRYSCERQPFTRLYFQAVDSGYWSRFFAVGPSQSGKTLSCFVIPILYHLFEIGENVIVAVSSGDMANDKWKLDIKPAIEASRYGSLMPSKGGGSQGGTPSLIQFKHGPALRFMTGGGSDKTRSGFTSRVVCITETDGFDKKSASSRESDQISQLEARTRAFGSRKRIYAECTVSTVDGRTWQEYTKNSESKIVLPCTHCGEYVSPEREHFRGWKDAETEHQAIESATFVCPACTEAWTEDDRKAANLSGKLVHKGQFIKAGEVVGELPQTNTLGFRWSAVNNLLVDKEQLAEDEFKASRDIDQDNVEKKLKQFVWAIPYSPDIENAVELSIETITRRRHDLGRGVFPADTVHTTIGFDSGKYESWFVELAWTAEHLAYVVDYGSVVVSTNDLGIEAATLATLHSFADDCLNNSRIPDAVWFDTSYETETHYRFYRELNSRIFQPVQGFGTEQRNGTYSHPKKKANAIRWTGEQCYCIRDQEKRINRVDLNADYWKSQAHKSLTGPVDRPCAVRLFNAPAHEHTSFAKHLLAEKKVEQFVTGRGLVTKWDKKTRANHLFDCLAYALAAGSRLGHSTIQPLKTAVISNTVEEPQLSGDSGTWNQNYVWNN